MHSIDYALLARLRTCRRCCDHPSMVLTDGAARAARAAVARTVRKRQHGSRRYWRQLGRLGRMRLGSALLATVCGLWLQRAAAADVMRQLQAAAAECTTADAASRIAKVQSACCPTEADCPTGWPSTCDGDCAPRFLDLFENCHDVILQLAGPPPAAGQTSGDGTLGIQAWDALRDSCIEGLREPVDMCATGNAAITTITESRGVLVDGSAEDPYRDNARCAVLLQAPPGSRVVIKFIEFDLDSTINPMDQGPLHTSADYVRLYDGADTNAPLISWLSGMNADSSAWASQSEQMLVTFVSGQAHAQYGPGGGAYVPNTAQGFKAVWTFSDHGASCDLNVLGSPLQPTPSHTLMGECGERDHIMSSGETCGLRCEETYGLAGAIQTSGQGDTAPTYPYFRDMVVCFDGTIEVHAFTCQKVITHAGTHYSHADICHPNAAKLKEPSGRLSDGSEEENYNTNVDCGVLLEAPEGEIVAVKFDEFDVGSIDRVDLYDGPDVNAPQIASLYGDFTCNEDPTDCDRMRHPPLSGADVGGYGSTGNQLYIHFSTRESVTTSAAWGAEGWLLTWLHSSGGDDCDLTGDWADTSTPAFASAGTCAVDTLRTGETCRFQCDGGLMPSSEADPAVWRTIRSFGPSIAADPLCWSGDMMNIGGMTCLQQTTCSNWFLNTDPSPADLDVSACPVFANSAPYPAMFALQEDYVAPVQHPGQPHVYNDNEGDMVWFKLDVEAGKTYTVSTRLGQVTFTWLYVLDSDATTEIASCVYCLHTADDDTDNSSELTFTADSSKTVFIKVHGSGYLGHGFVLTVDCDKCSSPADQVGGAGQCPPLQDPDGEGGVDVSQCRGIEIGHTCEARCDANTGYTGHPTRYTCGGQGGTWGWIADTSYPICTSSRDPPPPAPPPPTGPGGAPALVDFVHPIVNVIGTGSSGTGMDGYSTFQLALAFSSTDVANVYAIYGAPAVTSGPSAGTAAATMTIPPAFQSGAPFGGDVGGTNPMFWGYDPTARFDSWLTVGITDGHADSKLSSIGIDWDTWSETNGMTIDNGALFDLNPTEGSTADPTVVAQLSVPEHTDWTAVINARGKRGGYGGGGGDDWEATGLTFTPQLANSDGVNTGDGKGHPGGH